MPDLPDLAMADRLAQVRSTIAAAADCSGRAASEVTLVAVSKTVEADRVVEAARLGVRHFGENWVQEAEDKIPRVAMALGVTGIQAIEWHLIGHLQTNKARPAARLFSLIESVDSVRLAQALDQRARSNDRPIDVLLEVNVAGEASKFGFGLSEVAAAFAAIRRLPLVRVHGLMTVAPAAVDPEDVRPIFCRLRELRDDLRLAAPELELPHLSMGMTGDYPVAIEEGATIVRVGRAIFGERPAPA
jgi:pyridoxal phosphate enzyme (YggS family)